MKQLDRDNFQLSSGKKIFIASGILGIDEETDCITSGYDDTLWSEGFNSEESDLVAQDLIEICDYAISLWQQFRYKQIEKVSREHKRLG